MSIFEGEVEIRYNLSMSIDPEKWKPWLLAIRFKTLPAAISPVVVGTGLAYGDRVFKPGPAVACLFVAVLLQIGSNLANDVYDYEKGADSGVRYGPTRVTQSGLLAPQEVKRGMWIVFALTGLIGVYLVSIGGWVMLVLGLAAILSAIGYTGGVFPLGYHGLGDLFVFIFFGLVATAGTYYLQAGYVTMVVWWMGTVMGALTVNILVVNNLRDIESDRAVQKRTLAVRLGKKGVVLEYFILLCAAYLVPVYLIAASELSPWGLLAWLSLPLGVRWAAFIARHEGKALNLGLGGSGQVELVYSLLFTLGMILSRVV